MSRVFSISLCSNIMRVCDSIWLLLFGCVLLMFAASTAARDEPTARSNTPTAATTSDTDVLRIKQLIAQLGSDDFLVRREAESQLIALGALAFDHLQEAQSNADLEIATQAEYLLHRITVDYWVRPDDPAEVRDLMTAYAKVSTLQQREIIGQLAALDEGIGVGALSRITHFELSPRLAKYASLAVLEAWKNHFELADKVANSIRQEVGDSRRDAAIWLRAYADQLQQPKTLSAEWFPLIDAETLLLSSDPDSTELGILLRLNQFHLQLSRFLSDTTATFETLKRRIEFVSNLPDNYEQNVVLAMVRLMDEGIGTTPEYPRLENIESLSYDTLFELAMNHPHGSIALALSWVVDNQQWQVLTLLENSYSEEIKSERMLLYLVAVGRAEKGANSEAIEFAGQAHTLVDGDNNDRTSIADVIAEYGHHDWAEKEWQFVIDQTEVTSKESMDARRSLANWCLHDREEDQAAADLMAEVCEAVDADPQLKQTVMQDNKRRLLMSDIRKCREFFTACVLEKQRDYEAQRKHLDLAYAHQQDPDVLIAMYRIPEQDEAYHSRVQERVRQMAEEVDQVIERYPNDPQSYNLWAWLVSNTEGDFAKAIRYSHNSLELSPGSPSYLDTLGRCYYAAGDLENAIKYQRQAVEKHPQVQVMRRQLAMFEKALADSQPEQKVQP